MSRYRARRSRRIRWLDRPLYNTRVPFQDGFGLSAQNHRMKEIKKEPGTNQRKRFLDFSNKLADKIQHAEHSILRGIKREGKSIEKEVGKGVKWVKKEARTGIESLATATATKWAVEGITALFDIVAAPETGGASLAALPEELAEEDIEMSALERLAS
jgi:hypothetical protein